MSFGLYFHIPYCLQKCHYCDFTTFDLNHQITPPEYTRLLIMELRSRSKFVSKKDVSSIYFGGGTPSLLPAEDILTLRHEIANVGFNIHPEAEITIEINPGTISSRQLDLYLAAGVNRFSVGVQTFNDQILKLCGREHSADDSRSTLRFLINNKLNYSFDLLFGLPHQSLSSLKNDLDELLTFSPPHVSLYNLTVPKKHFMNLHRPDDEIQAEMFQIIEGELSRADLFRYELSNFARPGFESRHNQIYWSDQSYWGLGVSAHSYWPDVSPFGVRFWNPHSSKHYVDQVTSFSQQMAPIAKSPPTPSQVPFLPPRQIESLALHEALTDFCHTHLRMMRGLSVKALEQKFGPEIARLALGRLDALVQTDFLIKKNFFFSLSKKGLALANRVFLDLTFLPNDIGASTR